MKFDELNKTYSHHRHGDNWTFEKYVGRCSINGYSVAKYTDDNDMVLLQLEGKGCNHQDSEIFDSEETYQECIENLYKESGFIENSGTTVSMLIKMLDSKQY